MDIAGLSEEQIEIRKLKKALRQSAALQGTPGDIQIYS